MRERIVRVANPRKIETFGRANGAAGGTVLCFERAGDVIGGPSARSDTFKRADKASYLIVEERARADVKAELLSVGAGDLFDTEFVERAHRAVCLTDR